MILTESESKELLENVLKLSKADAAIATLSGGDVGNVRFALNTVTTSGFLDSLSVSIESHFGKRTGSVTTNEFDAASLETAVRKSESIARLAPENAEYLLPLGPQKYLQGNAYDDETANATPDKLALLCESPLKDAIAKNVSSAGFVESGSNVSAMMTTKGLFAYYKSTVTTFQMSARTPDGTGSGWVGINVNDLKRLDTVTLGKTAVDKTVSSANPIDLDAGKYTVILEPSAVADLVGMLVFAMDARTADEGRSFFTKKGGGNKLGEKIFNDNVTIYSDPLDLAAPAGTYSNDGLPTSRINWVENGVLKNLMYSRFWAEKSGKSPVATPTNVIMTGGTATREDLIKSVKRGILVTRLWYIREVDPQTLLLTGLTRDGAFLIENGRITKPVRNFRFNESPVAMLNSVEAMTPTERARGSEVEDFTISVPTLLVQDFTFSSKSEAI